MKTDTHLSSYFNRYYNNNYGVEAVMWLLDQYKIASGARTDVTFQLFEHTSWLQPSLIVTIEGGKHADETVVVGAHVDSIAGGSASRAPGADDNGSGTSALLQVFRALIKNNFVPDRTVEFHHYAAEEVGLRGSKEIAQEYAKIGRNVVAMCNLDMTGYSTRGRGGIFTDYTDNTLTAFLRKLWTAYAAIPYADSTCGYGCSDHASWYVTMKHRGCVMQPPTTLCTRHRYWPCWGRNSSSTSFSKVVTSCASIV